MRVENHGPARTGLRPSRRALRIAYFTETFLPATDGVVTRLRHTLDELSRLGDEVIVFAPSGGPERYAGARILGVRGIPFPMYPQVKLCPPHPGLGRALSEFEPDVVHVVNPVILGPGGVYYARRMGVPLVASYHTNIATYASLYRLGFLTNFARRAIRGLHNQANLNLCTSEATAHYLRNEGVRHVRLWPQGVDSRLFSPEKRSVSWRKRLSGGHPEDRLLLFVGRLAREKGISSLKHVLRELPGVRLAVVGDGPDRGRLEQEFSGLPATFTGFLHGEDLARAYASADLFLFPSTTETLGMAMLEAMASGLPVVAARSGASEEVVEEGKSGRLYSPKDPSGLVDAVSGILGDEERMRRLRTGARGAALGRNWQKATLTLRGYYEQLRRAVVR
ncbi:glycosyltransferase family 4 protein [Rubrobacter naiadicus]|uniref:glycosyltransferase family 4 protein n=1 Tax=Rubrobacter naiadicus TaxID=1392641 RepID=UPI00235E33CC|nr:glycosyltransferase family 1 protein [Rubrobacter naiadicus]